MKGIITRTLEVKAVFDNMAESLRPVFFKVMDEGAWWQIKGYNHLDVECEYKYGWIFLYGHDAENSCEMVFCPDEKTDDIVPAEYTVWNYWNQRTYHRFFKKF